MPELTREELAQQFGWSYSFFRSEPELWRLLNNTWKHEWTMQKFEAELRQTRWFRRHSEAYRKDALLRSVDPTEWRARRAELKAQLGDAAHQMGAVFSKTQFSRLVSNTMKFGLNDAQVRNIMARYVRFSDGRLFGEAAVTGDQLRQTALANGYRLSDPTLQRWARNIASGNKQLTDYQDFIRENAARSYKPFAAELRAGADLADLAAPWMETMAETWEMNPNEITMFNPVLQKAMSEIDPDTGQATTLTDFAQQLRKHVRYRSTKGAQDSATTLTRGLLRNFGFSV